MSQVYDGRRGDRTNVGVIFWPAAKSTFGSAWASLSLRSFSAGVSFGWTPERINPNGDALLHSLYLPMILSLVSSLRDILYRQLAILWTSRVFGRAILITVGASPAATVQKIARYHFLNP